MNNICEMIYGREREYLSEYAFLSENTRGREFPITPCDLRTDFQRDRDRIIHCKAFRRLMYKTQVFLSPDFDHYRTRLTHTLEVSQVARTIARALRLNEDLCEAIALGHDLGHTPFGHAGERVLRRCYDPNFTHYSQSLRVVEKLEKLNLTYEVREGIFRHTVGDSETLEGRIIYEADHIAYINHDIDDAVRAGVLDPAKIPYQKELGVTHGERIDKMVKAIISESDGKNFIKMEPRVRAMTDDLHEFLYENVYKNPVAKGQEGKAEDLLLRLFEYFVKHPDEIRGDYAREPGEESVERIVCDYIAGMTDRYALYTFEKLFIPRSWHIE